ncbi:tetR family transcriptional regulatory protein [Streptomyces zinciresistens K42]|uniref:TetR family transcriptional regulatory protein n=1 Tax=Streptomyces zinciresistens K42 TaxID=700597 RepID=G2G9L9_9ACTN|nr:TetR/AcrR family transcriptional regulator [Streptomyces zinciresistens]EGX59798.1 tetR family transcriptional regulatory protein [Streptomyces zinciresistens K42]
MTSGKGGTETSGSGDVVRTMELLWDTGRRPSRGPKPALTLDRIVAAAVRVADAEGLEAVSMRRVAAEVGTGTMSLYRYVPGKGELLDLMLDRVQRPSRDPADPGTDGWRTALEAMARATLDLYRRHPWLLQVNQSRPILGPSALESTEAMLARIKPTGLSDPELISAIVMIDAYVAGAARTQLYQREAEHRTGLTDTEFWQAQAPTLEKAMASGRYPLLASLDEGTWGGGFDHFEFGLQRILDGLEVFVARRPGTDGAPPPPAAG